MEGNLDAKVLKGKVSGFEVIHGKDGATFTPSVDAEGNLSWRNDQGLANPPTVNIKGKDGADGYTPVKGVDYFTEEDKQEIVDAVELEITEKVTAISVTEAEDGTVTMVNTLESGGTETIVLTADESGNPSKVTYNGTEIPIEWVVSA